MPFQLSQFKGQYLHLDFTQFLIGEVGLFIEVIKKAHIVKYLRDTLTFPNWTSQVI